MKKQYIFLIIMLFIYQKTLGQQDNAYYQKGIEIVLDSLVKENPKIVFYLNDKYTTQNTSDNQFEAIENCNINFDNLKQENLDKTPVIIPDKFRNRLKKNNFFNKIIYGRRLVELNVHILYKDSNNYLFRGDIYQKEEDIYLLIWFKNHSLEVEEFCKVYTIH